MSRIVTRTIYGAELQTCKELGIPHQIQQAGCLSDAILTNYAASVNVVPFLPAVLTAGMDVIPSGWDPETDTDSARIGYFCIGNGAHRADSGGTTGVPGLVAQPHRCYDSGPFYRTAQGYGSLLPFVVRSLGTDAVPNISNDLDAAERQNYRLRRVIKKDGTWYAAYFAKKLNLADVSVVRELVTVVNGVESVTPFTPTDSNMKPTLPTTITNSDTTLLRVSAPISVPFGPTDVTELRNACNILFGTEAAATISEVMFCHGVDRTIVNQYPLTGTQTPADAFGALPLGNRPKEVVGLQISIHLTTANSAVYSDDLGFNMNAGASEPLYGDLSV